jgi:hypothetical protein
MADRGEKEKLQDTAIGPLAPPFIWNPKDKPVYQRPVWRALSAAGLLGVAAWFASQFFQLRGYVNMLASRIDLAIFIFLILGALRITLLTLPQKRIVLAFILSVPIVIGAVVVDKLTLPNLFALEVYPKQFQFINPPMPNEMFTVTVSNKEDHSIYMVQFSLRIDDKTAKPNDFILSIPPGSIKILGKSKDGTRSVADIILFRCHDRKGRFLFVFFIPHLNAKESRDVTITSINHTTTVVYTEPTYYDEKPHSLSMHDGDVGFDLRLSSASGACDCQRPSPIFF